MTKSDEGFSDSSPDDGRSWLVPYWLGEAVDLPHFEVIDTRSAQGRLEKRSKTVTIADLILFHGHACDGLIRGAYAMRALADVAFAKGVFDRSDLTVVSKNSPCLGDVAAYLTGGRVRFGTHRLDNELGVGFVICKHSSGEVFQVREEPGFFPAIITAWEAALLDEAIVANGTLTAEEKAEMVAVNEAQQWDWVRSVLLPTRPAEHYFVSRLVDFKLPDPIYQARRTDVVNRNVPGAKDYHSPYEYSIDTRSRKRDVPSMDIWVEKYFEGPPRISSD